MIAMPETRSTAEALLAAMSWLAAHCPGGWSAREGSALAMSSGIPIPTLNGVWLAGESEPSAIEELLGRVGSGGLPHCLQFPAGLAAAAAVAAARGMVRDEDVPLMRLDVPPSVPALDGLAIRRLAPAEAGRHVEVAAAGFGAPPELFAPLAGPAMIESPDAAYYLGEAGGEAVTTGMGLRTGEALGVFDIATPEPHRRRGYGAAITARIAAEGFAAGAAFSWLQSSVAGRSVYAALGFETVAEWECWIAG